jgi:nucleoporin SEH1
MSIDFKNLNSETYLGLITRDGNLCIMEPRDHDNLSGDWADWMENRDFYVCPVPSRAQECSFKIVFHKEKLPCWTAVAAGLNRRALSFAVIAMDVVKIYRTDNERRIYIAAILEGAKDLVRDVAWANGSMRGFDIIATASKDGTVRIYELRTDGRAGGEGEEAKEPQQPLVKQDQHGKPSGIGASLAGANKPDDETALDAGSDPSRIKQNVVLVAELNEHKGAVWRCNFSHTGDVLTTSGDDGIIRSWKRGVDMKWRQYAEINSGTAE